MKLSYQIVLVLFVLFFVQGCKNNNPDFELSEISGYIVEDTNNIADVKLIDVNGVTLKEAKTNNTGKYTFYIDEKIKDKFKVNELLAIEGIKKQKKFRGLILNFSETNNKYIGNDTYLSFYSEALFRIADSLSLNYDSIKHIYDEFLKSYKQGEFNINLNSSYQFAFRNIIDEIADNIKDNYYNNAPLITSNEIIEKIKSLNNFYIEDLKNNIPKYSLPILKDDENSIFLQIISFKDAEADNDFSVDIDVSLKSEHFFYDSAALMNVNFSDADIKLNNAMIQSFYVDKTSKNISINEEYQEILRSGNTFQVIENNRIKLVLNQPQNSNINNRLRSISIKDEFTDVYYKGGKAYVKLVFDTEKLNFFENHINNYDLYVNVEVYDNGMFDISFLNPDEDSNIIDLEKGTSVYEYEITHLINRFHGEDKHLPVRISLYENDFGPGNDDTVQLEKCYGFIDWENDYDNATIAKLTIQETMQGLTAGNGDNVFDNKKGYETKHLCSTTTHRIIDFDKIVDKDILLSNTHTNFPWKDTDYSKKTVKLDYYLVEDNRIPLLLIHGWQGDDGLTYPSKLLKYENSEFAYWHNFISYYLSSSALYSKFKLYTYHYPSYKHITYNARMLTRLFNYIKTNKPESVIGKGLNEKGVVLLAHSMGGLVARSLIEEHKGLGSNSEKLIKLITLDTPHHGSPSSISSYWSTQAGDLFAKDMDTPGVVDLLWDNYDNKYNSNDDHFKSTVTELSNGDSRHSRLNELIVYKGIFDTYYRFSALSDGSDADVKNMLNPYLYFLNRKFSSQLSGDESWINIAQEKYIIYAALTPYGPTDNPLSNPIDNDNNMLANTLFINTVGYASGGAEPIESALFSWNTLNLFPTNVNELDNIPPNKKFITIGNDNKYNNNMIPYRLFWDYDHETIMNGQYKEKGDWDKYIDIAVMNVGKSDTETTNFSDIKDGISIVGESVQTVRYEYIDFADQFFNHGKTNKTVDINTIITNNCKYNPLKYEPVFRVIHKDLLDSLNLDNIVYHTPMDLSGDFEVNDNIILNFLYPYNEFEAKIMQMELVNNDSDELVDIEYNFSDDGKAITINPKESLLFDTSYIFRYHITGGLINGKSSTIQNTLSFMTISEDAPKDVVLIGSSSDGIFNYKGGKFRITLSPLDKNEELISNNITTDNFLFKYIKVTPIDQQDEILSWGKASATEVQVKEYDQHSNVSGVIILDSSGSMSNNDPQNLRIEAAKKFVDTMDTDDIFSVIDFGAGTTTGQRVSRLLCDFTNDTNELKQSIDKATASGGTPLFESILDGIDMLKGYPDKSRVIIVLTDGKADSNDNFNSCIQNAKDNDIMLYTIGLGSNLDFSNLGNLSSETNGAFANASNSSELELVYNNIGIATFKGKVSVSVEGEFIPPLLKGGDFSVSGELLTTIERKTIETSFNFTIQVEQE